MRESQKLFEKLDAELRKLTEWSDPTRWIIITHFIDKLDFESDAVEKDIREMVQRIIDIYS